MGMLCGHDVGAWDPPNQEHHPEQQSNTHVPDDLPMFPDTML